jgi:hypothetical protein
MPKTSEGVQLLLEADAHNETTILVFALIAALLTVLQRSQLRLQRMLQVFLLVVVCCLWPSAGVIVDLFKQAGRAVQAMPMLLLQPLFTCVVLMVFFALWCSVALLLATSSKSRIPAPSGLLYSLVLSLQPSQRWPLCSPFPQHCPRIAR